MNRRTKLAQELRTLAIEMLTAQLKFDTAWRELDEEDGIETNVDEQLLEEDNDFFFQLDSIIQHVADLLGIPADNTVETNACDIANRYGAWPKWAYCRDWLSVLWDRVHWGDTYTVEDFVDDMIEHVRTGCDEYDPDSKGFHPLQDFEP